MKYLSFIFVFLVVSWFPSFNIVLAEDKEKVIVISEIVGEVIDAEEREQFALFPQIDNFKSAVFLQLSDGSYVAEVTFEENGEEKTTRTPQAENSIASLKYYIENYEKVKPKFEKVKPKLLDLGIKKQEIVRTPFSSGKVTGEILGGIGGGAVLGIGCGLIGYALAPEGPQDAIISSKGLAAFLGFIIAYPIGSVIGVYTVGNMGNETGSFAATLGGGVLGTGVGIGAIAIGIPYISFLFPPIGSTIGFNMTRRYRNPPTETGLINYRDGRLGFALPLVYYTQENTFEGKIITQNVTLVQISF